MSFLPFFDDDRRISNHIGDSPIKGGYSDSLIPRRMRHLFIPSPDLPRIPEPDVVKACSAYLKKCIDLVYRLYTKFRISMVVCSKHSAIVTLPENRSIAK